MKSFLNASLLLILFSSFFSNVARGQAQSPCTYTATRSGNFSEPGLFAVTGGTSCAAIPVSGSNAIIVISGFDITLDRDFVIGKDGSITVSSNNSIPGTLTGNFNLSVGVGTGAQNDTKLRVEAGSTVRVDQLLVDKANIFVAGPMGNLPRASLITECNVVLLNSSITDDGLVLVRGNLDLSDGGANNTLCGNGGLAILGCVFGGNGAVGRITRDCAAAISGSPTVCAQKSSTPGCPGPAAGTNASERSCDELVTSTGPCFTSVLPVELVQFSAVPDNQRSVVLRWVTASEKNSESFTVQRSADGRTFRDLGRLAGAGSVQRYTEYRFVDEQPLAGVSYYRLLQRDTDGTTSLSPVRVVKVSSANVKGLEVYPGGPAQQWVVSTTLAAEVISEGTYIQVIDAVGRIQRVAPVADAAQTGRWTLDLQTLPSGVYIVRLITPSGNFSQRIAK
jgi:hypothetical protein